MQELVHLEFHSRSKKPRRAKTTDGKYEPFSVTVITCNCGDPVDDPMINLGYYNFDMRCWLFHTDTLFDMTDVNFVWCYPPTELFKYASKFPETF